MNPRLPGAVQHQVDDALAQLLVDRLTARTFTAAEQGWLELTTTDRLPISTRGS